MPETETCPYCKSDKVAQILYGTPAFSEELRQALAEGKIVLGGCAPMPQNRTCLTCKKDWGSGSFEEQPADQGLEGQIRQRSPNEA